MRHCWRLEDAVAPVATRAALAGPARACTAAAAAMLRAWRTKQTNPKARHGHSTTRPNILFIMADQMAAPLLPVYDPNRWCRCRTLAVWQNRAWFESAYCPSPLCAPSRYSLVSGQLPSQIGGFDNAANFASDIPTYAHYLRDLGYRTALSGKMPFCGPDQLHGYEDRLTADIYPADYGWAVNWDAPGVRPSWYHNMSSVLQAGPSVRTNQLDHDEETVFKARQYLYDHVRNHPEQPFCLTVSMTHPHDPYTIPAEFFDLYRDESIPMPRHRFAQTEQDAHSQRLLQVIDLWDKPLTDEAIRRARRAYFGSCSYVDAKIGELRKTLADCGLADDAIVVFSGDHGDTLGERGLWYKMHWFGCRPASPWWCTRPGSLRPGGWPTACPPWICCPLSWRSRVVALEPELPDQWGVRSCPTCSARVGTTKRWASTWPKAARPRSS